MAKRNGYDEGGKVEASSAGGDSLSDQAGTTEGWKSLYGEKGNFGTVTENEAHKQQNVPWETDTSRQPGMGRTQGDYPMNSAPSGSSDPRMMTSPQEINRNPYAEGGEYQQGGEVRREPTHVTHNNANQRMIAHFARRDPQHAKHLLRGLRREHNGLRAMATAALAHSHGLRHVGRHELAHGHDAHALHMLNMAHAKVPDGAELCFTQHNDHDFNARVRRGNREHNFPLNRNQMMQFGIGPAGGFDHSIDNGVEKNLTILSRGPRRAQAPGYQAGGEVVDPYSDLGGMFDPNANMDPDAQAVRAIVEKDRRDHGLIEPAGGRRAIAGIGLPQGPAGGRTALDLGATVSAIGNRIMPERTPLYGAGARLGDYLNPTTENSANDAQLEEGRRQAELATTYGDYGPQVAPILRGRAEQRRAAAEKEAEISGRVPTLTEAEPGPAAPVERVTREPLPGITKARAKDLGPTDVMPPGVQVETDTGVPKRTLGTGVRGSKRSYDRSGMGADIGRSDRYGRSPTEQAMQGVIPWTPDMPRPVGVSPGVTGYQQFAPSYEQGAPMRWQPAPNIRGSVGQPPPPGDMSPEAIAARAYPSAAQQGARAGYVEKLRASEAATAEAEAERASKERVATAKEEGLGRRAEMTAAERRARTEMLRDAYSDRTFANMQRTTASMFNDAQKQILTGVRAKLHDDPNYKLAPEEQQVWDAATRIAGQPPRTREQETGKAATEETRQQEHLPEKPSAPKPGQTWWEGKTLKGMGPNGTIITIER